MLNPYPLVNSILNGQEGFSFSCAVGNDYFIYHTDVSETCGNPEHAVLDVSFTRPTLVSKKVRDSRVRDTICNYFDELMHERDAVIVYAPVREDKKHNARLKHFDKWTQELKTHFKCSDILTTQFNYEIVVDIDQIETYNYVVLYRPHQSHTVAAIEKNTEALFTSKN